MQFYLINEKVFLFSHFISAFVERIPILDIEQVKLFAHSE